MAAIKKFFEKRKMDVKFKRAGEGHKLTENTRNTSIEVRPSTASGPSRAGPSHAALTAAEAAMARASQPKPGMYEVLHLIHIRSFVELEGMVPSIHLVPDIAFRRRNKEG